MEKKYRKYFGIMYKGDELDPVYFKNIGITKCEQMRENEMVKAVIGIKGTSRPHRVEQCAVTAGLVLQPIDGQLVCTFGDVWPASNHWFYQTVKQHESYKVWTTEIKEKASKVFGVMFEGDELTVDSVLQAKDENGIVYALITMPHDARVEQVRAMLTDKKLLKIGANTVHLFKGVDSHKKHMLYKTIMQLNDKLVSQ